MLNNLAIANSENKMNKTKKNALITGSTRGIGLKIAKVLKENGINIFITGRDEKKLKEEAKSLDCLYFVCDLADYEGPQKLFYEYKKHYNTIDILINNAGLYEYESIEKASNIEEMINVNIKAPFILTKLSIPYMKEQKWGRIINIGSISGVMGEANASIYSGTKSALIGFTKAIALEIAQYNVTANVINPGWVKTDMGIESMEESDFPLDLIPQKRFVEALEIAKLILYLISDDAKGITGQSINLCAGLTCGI